MVRKLRRPVECFQGKDTFLQLRKGLKAVHIGNEMWTVGKIAYVDDPTGKKVIKADGTSTIKKVRHQVIYGPNKQLFHVYDNDVELLYHEYDPRMSNDYYKQNGSNVNRHGNNTIESSVKIYILTYILDKPENWCFDLKSIPEQAKLKVIYNNGTVKNIEFNGVFEPVEIDNYCYTGDKKRFLNNKKLVYPIAYRK